MKKVLGIFILIILYFSIMWALPWIMMDVTIKEFLLCELVTNAGILSIAGLVFLAAWLLKE